MNTSRPLIRRLASREGQSNPHVIFATLREAGPLHDTPHFGPALTRYADVRATLFNRSLRVSAASAKAGTARADIAARMPDDLRSLPPWLFLMDEPDHTRLRKLLAPIFSQSAIDRIKPQIRRYAARLIDDLQDRSEIDLVQDFAIPLPLYVIGELLGLDSEAHQLRPLSEALVYQLHALAAASRYDEAVAAHRTLAALFRDMVRDRRASPRRDVASHLAGGLDRGCLSEDECVSLLVNLLVAGHITTADLISSMSLILLRNPAQLEHLLRNPHLWPRAVEEALRLEPPTPMLARVHGCPFHAHGRQFEEGDTINVFIASANRDPQVFREPDRFDLARRECRHMSFGGGAHFCLGAPLARAEAAIAVRLLFERMPHMSLAEEALEWRSNPNFRGLVRLSVANRDATRAPALSPQTREAHNA